MVADHVPVLAVRARDQHRPVVVPVLGHAMPRPRVAGLASKGELVVGLLADVGGLWLLSLGLGLGRVRL